MYLRAALYTVFGLILMGALVFWPAGTFDYWQGWAIIAAMVALSAPYTVYLITKAPDVLERRIRSGPTAETRPLQKLAVVLLQVGFLAILPLGGLDHRFGWSNVPAWLCILGIAVFTVALGASIWVVVQNAWAAATIRVEAGQQLVTTGMYSVVRHPMYSAAAAMLVSLPIGLGTYWGLLPALVGLASLVLRTVDEEVMLRADLPGYHEYAAAVRHRLIPGIW